jgi:hypothetical protein
MPSNNDKKRKRKKAYLILRKPTTAKAELDINLSENLPAINCPLNRLP